MEGVSNDALFEGMEWLASLQARMAETIELAVSWGTVARHARPGKLTLSAILASSEVVQELLRRCSESRTLVQLRPILVELGQV